MSAINDVLRAVRDVVVMNERVTQLATRLDVIDAKLERQQQAHAELVQRMIRMETFFDVLRPVILQQVLPPGRPPGR